MSASKTFKLARNENPALFAYDFDGVFINGNSHNDALTRAQKLSALQNDGDESKWREFAAEAIAEYTQNLEITLTENPIDTLRQYKNMLQTLQIHAENSDSLAIVTSNEFPEIVGTVLSFFAKQPGLEYLADIPIIYGGLFQAERKDIQINEDHGYFRVSVEEKSLADGGKNAHINKAMGLLGIDNFQQVAFIDDSLLNIHTASHIDNVIHAPVRTRGEHPFHETIRTTSEILKTPRVEYALNTYSDGGYPPSATNSNEEKIGTYEDAGLDIKDFENFSPEEREMLASPERIPLAATTTKPNPIDISQEGGNAAKARGFWEKMIAHTNEEAKNSGIGGKR